MAQFTPNQTADIIKAVTGQCEAIERMNAWFYNFGTLPHRRERAIFDLAQRAASAVGALLADMPPADVQEVYRLVMAVVPAYDARNHVAPAF